MKISQYSSAGTLDGTELVLGDQSGATKTMTPQQILNLLMLQADGATPASGDKIPIIQGGSLKLVDPMSLPGVPVSGNWTPQLRSGSTHVAFGTYSTQQGTYMAIGNLVIATFSIQLTSKGSPNPGNITLSGHPFTNPAGNNYPSAGAIARSYAFTGLTGALQIIVPLGNYASLYQANATGNAPVTDANITDTLVLSGVLIYFKQ